jgi:dipeptidase E
MKLLLTSSGISNPSIEQALVDLLGKPIADSSALIVPTAIYPFPDGPGGAWRAISGQTESPFSGLGWRSLGVLELTALPSIKKESWVPKLRETDALLVWGGHVMYLCYWMRRPGLADLLPSLRKTVYVGVSAGSIVMTPHNPDLESNLQWIPKGSELAREGDRGLGLVDFAVTVHVDREGFNTSADVEKWASGLSVPTYALDDQTALRVTEGKVEVVSEGNWRLFTPAR